MLSPTFGWPSLACALCAVAAIWWWLPAPRAYGPGQPTAARAYGVSEGLPRRRRLLVSGGCLAAALVAVATLAAGGRGAALTLAGVAVAATTARAVLGRLRSRVALRTRRQVAAACVAIASYLRVGHVPVDALARAAEDFPLLAEAAGVQRLGGDATRVWRDQSWRPGCEGLRELARAWEVATITGAPMAGTLEEVSRALARELGLRAVIDSELAAPRATGKVMAALPSCGVGLGYLLGGDPIGWLMAGAVGWSCLVLGVLLACAGVLWIEALAAGAAR